MRKATLRIIRTCTGALALAAAVFLPSGSAFAAAADVTVTQSGVPTIAPGATGTIDLSLNNPAGTGNAPVNSAVFTAPANTTITTTGYMVNGGAGALSKCTLNAASTVLTCLPPAGSTQLFWFQGSTYTVSIGVKVDASAPTGTTLAGGGLTMTDNLGAPYPKQPFAFVVKTPVAEATPALSPAFGPAAYVGSGAGLLIFGIVLLRRRTVGAR